MIARPVHRPQPIPFDTSSSASSSTHTRAISWAATLGPMGTPPVARLSPVKVSLAAAPTPLHGGHHTHPPAYLHGQAVKRPAHAAPSATALGGQPSAARGNGHAAASHDVGGPRRANNKDSQAMTEVSARYVGHGALSVRSSVTGRHYRFQGHGDSLVIDRNDVVLLKRISDLVIR